MYQRVIIIGRLGKDAELRYTSGGVPVCSFSVATDRHWKDESGNDMAKTTWFRVTAWKKLAEIVNQFCKKGDLVMVEGELSEPKPYAKRDGTYAASLDLNALTVKFLSNKRNEGEEAGAVVVEDEAIPF